MKARVKSTGELIDVFFMYENERGKFYQKRDSNLRFEVAQLDFDDTIDWEQRHYEISRDLFTHFSTMTPEQCFESADLFIAELKKQKNE